MKKRFWKRLTSSVLACSMVIGLLFVMTACESGEKNRGGESAAGSGDTNQASESSAGDAKKDSETAGKEEGEVVTLKVYDSMSSFSGLQMGWMADILREKFHAQVEISPCGEEEDPFSADIIIFTSQEEYASAVKEGKFCDLEQDELIQTKGAYIYENMKDALDANRKLTSSILDDPEKNMLYGWGDNVAWSGQDHGTFFYSWDIRWDLYQKLGYPKIEDLDDLAAVLKKMHALDPKDDAGNKTYAVSLWPEWDQGMVMNARSLATGYYGYDEMNLGLYDSRTGKYYDALMDDGPYLEMLRWYNGLYREGLLDPDSRKQTYDQMAKKVKKGGILFSVFDYAGQMGFNTDKHMKKGEYMYCRRPDKAVPAVYGKSIQGSGRITTINADSKNKEVCMEILNWLCTPEGRMTTIYGPKDLCWKYDEEGHCVLTKLGQKCRDDLSTPLGNGYEGTFQDGFPVMAISSWWIDATNPDSNGDTYNYESWYTQQEEPKYEIQKDWVEQTGCRGMKDYMEQGNFTVIPEVNFTASKQKKAFKAQYREVEKAINSNSWNAIYAKTDVQFDAAIAKMKKEAAKHGYQNCLKWCRKEAKRRKDLEGTAPAF